MSKEAEKLAEQLRDMVPGYRTPSHERGVLNDAIQTIRLQAEQIMELREALEELKCSVNFKAALIVADAEVMKVALADDQLWVAVDRASAVLSNTKEET